MPPFSPRPARRLPRIRRRIPRSALPFWVAAIALACLTGSLVDRALDNAHLAEARWDDTRSVAVASRDVEIGEPLAGATHMQRLPSVAIPSGALGSLPRGRLAMSFIGTGEVLTDRRVSGEGRAGAAALLPPGSRAIVVPLVSPGLPVEPGDRVDLFAAGSEIAADLPVEVGAAPDPAPTAMAALVVEAGEKTLVVALSPQDARRVAAALVRGPLVPALVGPGA